MRTEERMSDGGGDGASPSAPRVSVDGKGGSSEGIRTYNRRKRSKAKVSDRIIKVESEADFEDHMSDIRCKHQCPPKLKKKKYDAFEEKIDGVLDKIVSSATCYRGTLGHPAPTIADCYASLQQTPRIDPDSQLYACALLYFLVPEHRELWMLEQNPDIRAMLLQSHFSSKLR